jgi:hypothetical protein
LTPGQFRTGSKILSYETGLTRQCLRTSLKILEKTEFLTIESTRLGSIITVLKYSDYQILQKNQPTNQPTPNQPLTNLQPTPNQPLTTNEEFKNLRTEEIKDIKDLKPKHARRQKTPTVPQPECVAIYRDIFHYNLNPASREEVLSVVGNDGNMELWRSICKEWALRGYNVKNLKGMLDCFRKGKIEDKKNSNSDGLNQTQRAIIEARKRRIANGE